jgi:hypothetical protein
MRAGDREMGFAAGRNIDPARLDRGAVEGLENLARTAPIQTLREAAREAGGHVLGDDRGRTILGVGAEDGDQRLHAARRRAYTHDAAI